MLRPTTDIANYLVVTVKAPIATTGGSRQLLAEDLHTAAGCFGRPSIQSTPITSRVLNLPPNQVISRNRPADNGNGIAGLHLGENITVAFTQMARCLANIDTAIGHITCLFTNPQHTIALGSRGAADTGVRRWRRRDYWWRPSRFSTLKTGQIKPV